MPQPKAATQALARIQRLCCLGFGSEMLMPDLIREVAGLIPSQGGVFWWLGSNLEIKNVYSSLPDWINGLWLKEFQGTHRENQVFRPFRQFMTIAVQNHVHQFVELLVVDYPTFLRSDYYNVICRPSGCGEVLMLRVRGARRTFGVLYLFHAVGAPVEHRNIKILELIAGFVAHGMTRARSGEDAFADSEDRALFVTDVDGTVRHAGPQARFLLTMALNPRWLPTAEWRGMRDPLPEIARLGRTLAATANGKIGQTPPVLRLRTPWGEFVLRAYWFGPTDGTERTRQIGITIERRVPRSLALLRRVEETCRSRTERSSFACLGETTLG